MRHAKLVGIAVAVCTFTSLSGCGSGHRSATPPTTVATVAPARPTSSRASSTVHVALHHIGTGSLKTGIFEGGHFDAPPLGSGTWSQQAGDPSCRCWAMEFRFQAGDQLNVTDFITVTAQSNPPPPVPGGVNTLDLVFTVKGGTGRFATARGVLRGPAHFTVTSYDSNTGEAVGVSEGTTTGDITISP